MRESNISKTIALVVGVLAMVFSISFIVWAWTEPGVIPPGGNVSAPINVGSTPQTKFGNLTLQNLYLNATGNEGDVYNADEIIGYGDLILRGKSGNAAPIYLEGTSVIINNDPGTGNVGIGTTNPGARLDIRSSAENVMTLIGSGDADTKKAEARVSPGKSRCQASSRLKTAFCPGSCSWKIAFLSSMYSDIPAYLSR